MYLTTAEPSGCGTTANWPVQSLGANGLLISWWGLGSAAPGSTIQGFPGRKAIVGGHPARIAIRSSSFQGSGWMSSGCELIGAQRTMQVVIQQAVPGDGEWVGATVCLRGPSFAARESAIRRILSTVRFPARAD